MTIATIQINDSEHYSMGPFLNKYKKHPPKSYTLKELEPIMPCFCLKYPSSYISTQGFIKTFTQKIKL